MKLESQVVSLGLAKRLKELGVKQESYFAWALTCIGRDENSEFQWDYRVHKNDWQAENEYISAFTVAELGEMLPDRINPSGDDDHRGIYELRYWRVIETRGVNYSRKAEHFYGLEAHVTMKAETEADARAQMLIYLIENGLVKV